MTHTAPEVAKRARVPEAPAEAPGRRGPIWILVAMAVLIAGVIAGALSWPDDEVELSGELTWSMVTESPAAHLLAVVVTDDGFLAASPVDGGGVDFWISDQGHTWEYAGRESAAFGPTEIVERILRGPAGYVADVEDRSPEGFTRPGGTSVWTSSDGLAWTRTELVAPVAKHASPYMLAETHIEAVVSGPGGYIAYGRGGYTGDLEKIIVDYGLDPAAEFHGWYIGEGPSGYELFIDVGDESRVIPIEELGLTEEDAIRDIEATPLDVYMWWSSDGVAWDPIDVTRTPFAEGTWSLFVTATDEAFYAFAFATDDPDMVGEFGTDDPDMVGDEMLPSGPAAYRSEDGLAWTELDLTGLPGAAFIYDVAVHDGAFYASGADDAGQQVWTSPDFAAWTLLAETVLLDTGRPGEEFAFDRMTAGDAGLVATGMAIAQAEDDPESGEPPEVSISKSGYTVSWRDQGIILAEEATGNVIAEISWETFESETVEVIEDDLGNLEFVDTTTGDELIRLDREEINAAFEEAFAGFEGPEPDQTPLLRYSIDGQTWTLDDTAGLFGDDTFVLQAAVGGDSVVALVITDLEAWFEYAFGEAELQELPVPEVWVGDATAGR